MPRLLRLVIWDALFFLILTTGYAVCQYLGEASASAYLVSVLTCCVCGAFLAQLSLWGIGWAELLLVGLPALYLALAPFLCVVSEYAAALPCLVPDALVQSPSASLRLAGAGTVGFLIWEKFH